MEKTVRARYTLEFKQGAVRLIARGQNVGQWPSRRAQ